MSRIYMVRHGQAGTRHAYDSLSDLGRRQTRLLGEYFAAQEIRFAAAYSGELVRQRQTGEDVRNACLAAGSTFPEIEIDPHWNEFDLDQVYTGLAPQLSAADPEFQREYEEMTAQACASADDDQAPVHRRWMPCDVKIISAWLRSTYTYTGETWEQFRTRVTRIQPSAEGDVVVFTSATPIGIWVGRTLDITDERVMKLAGALHNASYTVIGMRRADSRLHTFNAVPHLTTPELRTWR